jgi:Ser/Thr protein kinase RdoA (MazF antagonist)
VGEERRDALEPDGAVLERLAGGPVPPVVAAEPGRVLMAEVPGEDQYEAPLPVLLALVALLVELQVRETGHEDELLALGLPDWRAPALSAALEDVVRRQATTLDPDDRQGLARLLDGLDRRWSDLAACGLPDTLVHGDFHPGNARGRGDRLVLLDWGDCGVGHPLLDQPGMVERVDAGKAGPVRDAWERAWLDAVPGSDPRRAAALLAPVAAARQAVVYQRFLDGIEPSEHAYHRDDPAWWLRRAAAVAR